MSEFIKKVNTLGFIKTPKSIRKINRVVVGDKGISGVKYFTLFGIAVPV